MLIKVIDATTVDGQTIVAAKTEFGVITGRWDTPECPVWSGEERYVELDVPGTLVWGTDIVGAGYEGFVLESTSQQSRIRGILEAIYEFADGSVSLNIRVGGDIVLVDTTGAPANTGAWVCLTIPGMLSLYDTNT
jgi:hypothetical protein